LLFLGLALSCEVLVDDDFDEDEELCYGSGTDLPASACTSAAPCTSAPSGFDDNLRALELQLREQHVRALDWFARQYDSHDDGYRTRGRS